MLKTGHERCIMRSAKFVFQTEAKINKALL